MVKPTKRKKVSAEQVRAAWQRDIPAARKAGFCEYSIEAIEDDRQDLKVCWCCGALGYQEVAHIVPFSLGGRCVPFNMFLLCNECHVSSPDFLDPRAFIDYVNRNAGRASAELSRALDESMAKVKRLFEESPEKATAVFDGFEGRLNAATDSAKKMVSAHGVNVSHATKMACIDRAVRDCLGSDAGGGRA